MPPVPKIGQGIPGGLGALPLSGGLGIDLTPVDPKQVPHIHPNVQTPPFIPTPQVTAPQPLPGIALAAPLTQLGAQNTADVTAQLENNALKVAHSPNLLRQADTGTLQMLFRPTARLAQAIQSDPQILHNYQTVVYPKVAQHLMTVKQKDQVLHQLTGGAIDQQQALQSGLVGGSLGSGYGAIPFKLESQLGDALVGLGPGLAKAAYGQGQDIAATTHGDFSFKHDVALGKHIGESYKQTGEHPLRQLKNNPLDFVSNAVTPFFLGAGAAARGAELGRAGELADAAGISKARQIGKTLLRPQPAERSISSGENGLTLQPPAYKSALGGLVQKHVLDPRLEKQIITPSAFSGTVNKVMKALRLKPGSMAAAGRFGRKARIDMENDIRIRAHALATRMPDDEAANLARGTAFTDRWQGLHNGAVDYQHTLDHPSQDWIPIKEPDPGIPNKPPEFLTPADLKAHPTLTMNGPQLARQFDRGGKMIPSLTDEIENPEHYRYVPGPLIRGMKPYQAGEGTAANLLNASDHVTQIIRSGRFLTPAYLQWAAQNGLIGLSQQGAFMFRNALALRTIFPKLPEDVRGAIDGGAGKGIAQATGQGGEASAGGMIAKRMHGIQEFWHKLDDQWARRMAVIHELNHAGATDAKSITKLYRTDPAKFRKIVGGQGNREAINYTEMTPAERATFQKLFTAYGWTRGATTYAARFPLMHPVQARAGIQLGQQGHKDVEAYYAKLHGMAPQWLQSYLPLGGGKLLGTEWLNPAGTLGGELQQNPTNPAGQEGLVGNLSPTTAAALEFLTGQNKYGQSFKGTHRLTAPIGEMLGHFKPTAVLNTLGAPQKGGTFEKSPESGALKMAGVPIDTLRNPTQTAGLGEKDYEASLSTPDKVAFQLQQKLQQLPAQLQQFQHVTGQPLDANTVSRLKSDYDAVEQRDIFQYQYAQSHGAKTWKALPPVTKLAGTLDWMAHHGYSHAQIAAYQQTAGSVHDDKTMESLVNTLWQGTGIGQYESAWKSVVKGMNPATLTKSSG